MKNLITLLFSVLTLICHGQNSIPEIEITGIVSDEMTEMLSVNYSLNDLDGDACEVWLKMSVDGGTYFEMIAEENLSGDTGDNINPNETLSLSWNYTGLTEDIETVHIQIFASDNQAVDISDMVSQVSEAELLSTMESIVGERHYTAAPDHLAFVRSYMMDAFSNANLQTEEHNFEFDNTDMQNILGRKPGAKDEGLTYIIDGHFDAVIGSPGADDNGSAVAGVLEAVRILSQYSFEHSIRFIGFDAEELGIIGSQKYVLNGIKPYEDIQGVLNFEMIGYYSDEANSQELPSGFDFLFPDAAQEVEDDEFRGNFIFGCGNTSSNPLREAFILASETYVPELRVITVSVPGTGTMVPDLRRSDHARFWDAGLQALMLTDAANFRNPNYHTPGDSIGTLNFEFMKNVVKATLATAAQLAIPISASSDEADLSTILSVDDNAQFPADVRLFPNPSNGLVSIQVENAKTGFESQVEVYEVSGKRVYRDVLHLAAGSSTSSIDLRGVAAGSYVLVLRVESSVKNIGFVVK